MSRIRQLGTRSLSSALGQKLTFEGSAALSAKCQKLTNFLLSSALIIGRIATSAPDFCPQKTTVFAD